MRDSEGSAYVPGDDALWLADDDGERLFEVDRSTGALRRFISNTELRNTPRLGGGTTAGANRSGDLESMAYDPIADVLYAFSGPCCSSSELPTAFRLTRGTDGRFRVESYQPLASGSDFTAATVRPTDGKLYGGHGRYLREYNYVSNTQGPQIEVSGLSGILGLTFTADGTDLIAVTSSERLYRAVWATRTLVPGWNFDLTQFGVGDSRAVEYIGNQLFVADGDTSCSTGDPLRLAVYVLDVSAGGGDTTPPDSIIDSGPPGTTTSTTATFAFSATEPGSTFACRLDGANFSSCTSPKTYSGLAPASHGFEVRATDAAGNPDPSPASWSWTIGTTGQVTRSFAVEADASVFEANPTTNFGTAASLKVDSGPQEQSYLRFTVGGVSGAIQSATMRVFATNGSANGPAVYATGNSWLETGITWNSRPAQVGAAADDKGSVTSGTWIEFNVTALVSGNGTFSFVLVPTSSDGMDTRSRQASTNRPELVVVSSG